MSYAAIAAAYRAGLTIFTLPRGEKATKEKGWQNHKPPTADTVFEWLRNVSAHNYAVMCGHAGLVVIDIDKPKPKDECQEEPYYQMRRLIATRPFLARAPLVRTGGGGWHIYVKVKGELPKTIIRATIDGKPSTIDIKTSGYVVAPASLHPNGRPYELWDGSFYNIPTIDFESLKISTPPKTEKASTHSERTQQATPASDTSNELLRALKIKRIKGQDLQAYCPSCHNDTLIYNPNKGRSGVYLCACGDKGTGYKLARLVGVTLTHFTPSPTKTKTPSTPPKYIVRHPVTGDVTHGVHRRELPNGKDTRPASFIGGQWFYGLNGRHADTLPFFGLFEAADAAAVIITEGEKKADTFNNTIAAHLSEKLGYSVRAVSVLGGVNGLRNAAHLLFNAAHLKGKKIYIAPDIDSEKKDFIGQRAALAAQATLKDAGFDVRLIDSVRAYDSQAQTVLPTGFDKFDIGDAIEAKGISIVDALYIQLVNASTESDAAFLAARMRHEDGKRLYVCSKYISDAIDSLTGGDLSKLPKALVIKSYVGSGKTELQKRLYAQAQNENHFYFSGAPLRALNSQTAERIGIEHYENLSIGYTGCYPLQSTTITPQSFHKLDTGTIAQNNLTPYMAIDEARLFARAFTDSTCKENRAESLRKLKAILGGGGRSVLMGADIDENTLHFYERYGFKDYLIIENLYQPKQKPATAYKTSHALTQKALDLGQSGEAFAYFIPSKKQAKQKARLLEKQGVKVLLVTGDNSGSKEVLDAVNNTELLNDYQTIIYNTAWGAGVNIANTKHRIMLIDASLYVVPAGDLLQGLARFRDVAEYHFYAPEPKRGGNREANPQTILQSYIDKEKAVNGGYEIDKEFMPLMQSLAEFTASDNASKNRLRTDFIEKLKAINVKVSGWQDADHTEGLTEQIDAIKDELEAERIAKTMAADDIKDESEYKRLQNNSEKTEAETYAIKKYLYRVANGGYETLRQAVENFKTVGDFIDKTRSFLDVSRTAEKLAEKDSAAKNGYLPDHTYRLRKASFVKRALDRFDLLKGGEIYSQRKAELIDFLKENIETLTHFYGVKPDTIDANPVGVFKRVMRQAGFAMATHGKNDNRRHSLDMESLAWWLAVLIRRRACEVAGWQGDFIDQLRHTVHSADVRVA